MGRSQFDRSESSDRYIYINGIQFLLIALALPEYRNGGLLLDTNVLVPRNPSILNQEHEPSSEIVIEWRALTVAILDDVHKILLERLHVSADEFPLAKVPFTSS